MTNDIHILAKGNVSYKFCLLGWETSNEGMYCVIKRVSLSYPNQDLVYEGTYTPNDAREFWDILVANGFVDVDSSKWICGS